MSETLTTSKITEPAVVSEAEIEKVDRALIDQSAEAPLLFLYTSAILWLLSATLLGAIASFKLLQPDFLGGVSWLTYGRVWPAFTNAFAYGWASQVGMGTAIWLLARLTRVSLRRPTLLIFGTVFWNVGVTIGVIEILAGQGKGIEMLEFPGFAQAIIFVGFALIAAWGVIMFKLRRAGHTFISAWYLLAAFFWFGWLYSTGNLMVFSEHFSGVSQAAAGAWYANGFANLWISALGLGAVYYFLPKVSGRPIHSYQLASFGFWSFALFAGWTGMTRLIGAPLPAWVITSSIVAAILMLIPAATVTVNFVLTLRGNYQLVYFSPTIRFVFFGAIAYAVYSVVYVIGSMRGAASVLQYTFYSTGEMQLAFYAFYSMVMFGSIYYILPRLVGCEWLSSRLIGMHFLCSAYGIGLSVVVLLVAGIMQGASWSNPEISSTGVAESFAMPLVGCSIGWIALILGHFFFAVHFLAMLLRLGRPSGQPTLFPSHTEGGLH